MRSCILLSYLAVLTLLHGATVPAAASQSLPAAAQNPDLLYQARELPKNALDAEQVWAARVSADARDFESAWKLARVRYWLGTNGPDGAAGRKRRLEQGIVAARLAIAARPDAVEGHFWLAANMGALADAHGLRQGMRFRAPIKAALEKALALQPAYLDGSPDRALGRWYFKVPGLFGGDLAKSEAHLRKALSYNASSIISLLFLAETLYALDKEAEARATLQAALDAPVDPDWAPEDARFKAEAQTLLATRARRRQ